MEARQSREKHLALYDLNIPRGICYEGFIFSHPKLPII